VIGKCSRTRCSDLQEAAAFLDSLGSFAPDRVAGRNAATDEEHGSRPAFRCGAYQVPTRIRALRRDEGGYRERAANGVLSCAMPADFAVNLICCGLCAPFRETLGGTIDLGSEAEQPSVEPASSLRATGRRPGAAGRHRLTPSYPQ
jgi:hypothetical protein